MSRAPAPIGSEVAGEAGGGSDSGTRSSFSAKSSCRVDCLASFAGGVSSFAFFIISCSDAAADSCCAGPHIGAGSEADSGGGGWSVCLSSVRTRSLASPQAVLTQEPAQKLALHQKKSELW